MTTNQTLLVQAVIAYAMENYQKGRGWDVIVECFTDAELCELIGRCRTEAGALKVAAIYVKSYKDHEVAADFGGSC